MTESARIEAYLPRLDGYALSLAGNHHQAEDLVQECAVRVRLLALALVVAGLKVHSYLTPSQSSFFSQPPAPVWRQ